MKVICKVCNGKGKVDKDFAMGKCEKIDDDPLHRVCPACDGTGLQEEKEPVSYPFKPWDSHPPKKRRDPWPYPGPYKPFNDPPWDPFPKKKKFPKKYPIWCLSYR